ncbi:MAG: glucan 1,4-alpha-glucosidase [Bacteroidetes bacterium]|nr:glucan 1,4-alpha-glucosidase [Bacteroidota bacterium]MCL5026912.1 glucan 1,4-alpha-glucosidase [Chloroflexota bacterium]
MAQQGDNAPGGPGIPARWTSSAKVGVGASLSSASRVWFTLSHGILNEIYYPRMDTACTRDMGLIVTDGRDFFSEEKRQAEHEVSYIVDGVPAYHLVNTCEEGRYRIEKDVIADPKRHVVLQRTQFIPLKGSLEDYNLYVLLAPHLGNQGAGNTGLVGDTKGTPMLFAEREGFALALASSASWLKRSAGFVGTSDGWQDLRAHKQMAWTYARAEDGNVALTGEIDLRAAGGTFLLALGFGTRIQEAGHLARAALQDGFDASLNEYIEEWQQWQNRLLHLGERAERQGDGKLDYYRVSAAVLRTHEAKDFRGGIIASLSIPWGADKGDHDLGGYHLVWTRDLVETVTGLLAAGALDQAYRVIQYLETTQEPDGHWAQNMWLDGTPFWTAVQMDEASFPILLTDNGWQNGLLDEGDLMRLWPMIRQAASFVVCNGPVTEEDRWEEEPGYSPFTLAVEIAALLAAADLAEVRHEPDIATYLREVADNWNSSIEKWTYATGTELAHKLGIEGYYVRIAPPEVADGTSLNDGFVPIKNRPPGQSSAPAVHFVSPDALALVRFGLRSAHDPRIVNTVKAIDALLKVETPYGPAWHRYNDDGYGEHADGSAYDGTGIGRAWPLLTGERAHYEMAAGRRQEAERLMRTIEAFANEGGMLPEQVWDSPDIPEKDLFFGRASGSGMPLVWAHAEYIKLRRSLREGRVFDTPPQPVQRYLIEHKESPYSTWRFNQKSRTTLHGKLLRLELQKPAVVHWSTDGFQTAHDTETRDTKVGMHVADLPTKGLRQGEQVVFTFYWPDAGEWAGTNFAVTVG